MSSQDTELLAPGGGSQPCSEPQRDRENARARATLFYKLPYPVCFSFTRFSQCRTSSIHTARTNKDLTIPTHRAGLGYHAPQTSSSTTSQPNPHLSKASSSTEALRRRLLGKRAPSQPAAKPTFAPGSKPHPSKRHHQITDDDDEDDEESRSRLPSRHSTTNSRLKTKQPPPQPQPPPQSKIPPSKSPTSSPTTTTTPPAPPPPAAPPSPTASQIAASTVIGTKRKPAPGSYLEQLLAERAARRGVKKRKKKTKGEDG